VDRDTTPPKLTAGTPSAPIARGGLTALLFAARNGQVEAARTLIDAGADINLPDADGNHALSVAILNTHYDVAKLLLERGANPNLAAGDGRTPLYSAVEQHDVDWSPRPARKETDQTTSLEVIQLLLAHGANPNAQLRKASPIVKFAQDGGDRSMAAGATPFMRAARSADVEVMRLLLEYNAEPTLANQDGHTALTAAAGVGWSDKIKGTEAQALEAVKLCVELGLDVNAATDRGETAAHGAALRGADSIVKYLAERGAKLDVKNKQNFTPLDIALGKVSGGGAQPRPPNESTAALLRELIGPEREASADKPAEKPAATQAEKPASTQAKP
jgi:ankyrin repeat protein